MEDERRRTEDGYKEEGCEDAGCEEQGCGMKDGACYNHVGGKLYECYL
jgi:hypothetical protein